MCRTIDTYCLFITPGLYWKSMQHAGKSLIQAATGQSVILPPFFPPSNTKQACSSRCFPSPKATISCYCGSPAWTRGRSRATENQSCAPGWPPGTDHRGRALQACGGEGALCVALAGADFWTLGPAISACAQDVYSGENITISWPQVKFPFLLSQPLSNDNR